MKSKGCVIWLMSYSNLEWHPCKHFTGILMGHRYNSG